ncbi:hypothetical protein QYM36_004171, partial [Artemia franciscana]
AVFMVENEEDIMMAVFIGGKTAFWVDQRCYNIMAEVIDIDQEYENGDKDSDDSEPSNKKPRITKKRADQRYKTEWERESDFNEWLRKGTVQTGQNSRYFAH